jgi:transposase
MYASERNTDRVQERRRDYWQAIKDVAAEDLIFVDESGSNLAMARLQGRSLRGERVYDSVPLNRGKNVSIIAAIALKGLLAFVNILGASNSLVFEAFIARLLVPNLWKGACVVMDNASIHKEKEIRPLLEKVGAKLVFLPPYSPDFSPIENCWSKVKSCIRSLTPRTYAQLEEAIAKAFSQITLKDIHDWFTHCCYCSSPFKDPSSDSICTSSN